MKSSTILKLVLQKFVNNYDSRFPGICEHVYSAMYCAGISMESSFAERHDLFDRVIGYVKKYRPIEYSLYWWPTDDVETRIDVLQRAIVDAEAVGD